MSAWGGRRVMGIRARWQPLIDAGQVICPRCGLPILRGQRWHVGHQLDRALGGPDDLSNLLPEHGRCNEAAGGRLGHQLRGHRVAAPSPQRRLVVVPAVDRRSW